LIEKTKAILALYVDIYFFLKQKYYFSLKQGNKLRSMILICSEHLLLLLPLVLLLALGQGRQDRGHEPKSVPLGKVSIGTLTVSRLLISVSVSSVTGLFSSEKTSQRKAKQRENEGSKNKAEKAKDHKVLN
jgi:hypothetical protein